MYPPTITDPQVERILNLPEEDFLTVSEVFKREVKKGPTSFEVKRCAGCGEAVFTNKLKEGRAGRLLCVPCAEKEK